MTTHSKIAVRDLRSAMVDFVYHGIEYQCMADWPTPSELQHAPSGRGWPWLQQLSWFFELAQFEKRHQHHNDHYLLLRIYHQQRLFVVLPLRMSTSGRDFKAISNYYSPEFAPVCQTVTEHDEQIWPLLFAAMSTLWPQWRHFSMQPLALDAATTLAQTPLPKLAVFSAVVGHNWRATAANKTDYWQKRPSQLVNTLHRKKKKLQQHNAVIQISQHLTPELQQAYWHIYQRSWKQPEPGTTFIDWLLAFSSEQGQLRLGVMYIDEQPVAFQFWLVQQQQAAIVKLAQDQSFDALSPGTVLMAAMVDEVMATDGVTDIDFLTGNDPYKAQWMDRCLPLSKLDVINCRHVSGLLLYVRFAIRHLLGLWKSKIVQYRRSGKAAVAGDKTGATND